MNTQANVDRRIRTQSDDYFQRDIESLWEGKARAVDVRRGLSYSEFVHDYVRKGEPVVIKDGIPTDQVTPDTISRLCGHRRLSDLSAGGGSPILVRGRESSITNYKSLETLGDYLARFMEADLPYLTNLSLARTFPELTSLVIAPEYFRPNWSTTWPFSAMNFGDGGGAELFMSAVGGTYGVLHYDQPALFLGICQYFGKKLWWLCGPDQNEYLYRVGGRHHNVSRVNPFHPDLGTFPLFAHCKPRVVTLEAGDIMFVPSSWWHMTRAITPNISILHRVLNRHNLAGYVRGSLAYFSRNPSAIGPVLRKLIARN